MGTRTLLGLLLGVLLATSLSLNAVLIVPWARSLGLLVGFLSSFFWLAGFQTWVYCAPDSKVVLRWSLPVLALTAGLNAWALLGGPP